jgi:hypothetical protein
MGVHCFGLSRRPEKVGDLGITFPIRFFCKGKILSVGLGFPGKCFL